MRRALAFFLLVASVGASAAPGLLASDTSGRTIRLLSASLTGSWIPWRTAYPLSDSGFSDRVKEMLQHEAVVLPKVRFDYPLSQSFYLLEFSVPL